jgi:hypothetical protein
MSRLLLVAIVLLAPAAGLGVAQTVVPPTPIDQTKPDSSPDIPTKNSPPRKVWTNENLSEVSGSVSVVGEKRNQKSAVNTLKPTDSATVSQIRVNLQKLQDQLDELNQKLISFKDFVAGETVSKGSNETSKGYTRTPVNQQVTGLEQKKKKLEAQIDALVDEARKKGIEPGQLR